MKPIKLTAIILLSAIILSGVIAISALVGRHNKSVSKSTLPTSTRMVKSRPNVHIARMATVPMAETNSTAKPMEFATHYKQLPVKTVKKPITKNMSAQPNVNQRQNSPYRSLIMPEQIQGQTMPQSPEYKRYEDVFAKVEPYLRGPYSKEAILKMNAELIAKLPANYGKMVSGLDILKQQELITRQNQSRAIASFRDKTSKQAVKPNQPVKISEDRLYRFDNSGGKIRGRLASE